MHLRTWRRRVEGRTEEYWALVESYRTERGPRQRIVAYLGEAGETTRVRVERVREFGGPWLGRQVMEKLGRIGFLHAALPAGREEIPWADMAQVLILGRLCDPSRELALAERISARTARRDLLEVPEGKLHEDRLYRARDARRPHQAALEQHRKARVGARFSREYDLLLQDMTSTYCEGLAEGNELAQRGSSREHRPDCQSARG